MTIQPRCHVCGDPLDGAIVDLTFRGFQKLALNGISLTAHARCVRLEVPDRGIEMPARISDPVAEANLVSVDWEDGGWIAWCNECGPVGHRPIRDDAELIAAMHISVLERRGA